MAAPQTALVSDLSDEEFERRTLDAIRREFGPSGLVRFLTNYRSGHGDYTAERHQWQGHLSVEQIWQDMQVQGLTHPGPNP